MAIRTSAADVRLDHIHSEAVWQGIGEKLRDRMKREQPAMPASLQALMARLPELDRTEAPSIVPDQEP